MRHSPDFRTTCRRAVHRIIRRWALDNNIITTGHNATPINIKPGNRRPHLSGTEAHWETKAGDCIRHPNAYRRVGQSNMVYCPSTLEITVGERWLERRLDK
jgi:hypothetical protein